MDAAQAVDVTISVEGRPAQVRLSRDWRSRIADTGLGPAVVTALTNAMTARLTAWATGMAEQPDRLNAEPDLISPLRAEPGDPASRRDGRVRAGCCGGGGPCLDEPAQPVVAIALGVGDDSILPTVEPK